MLFASRGNTPSENECGCGSINGTQFGTLVNGTKDENLRLPGALILTHTHVGLICFEGNVGSALFPPEQWKQSTGPF